MIIQQEMPVVAGVDVGGKKKGFHAVAFRGVTFIRKIQSSDAAEIADWCRNVAAQVVGIDAPCRWSLTGRSRPAERELMARRIQCFSSPSLEAALAHPKQYFHWMLAGAELFRELEKTYTLYSGRTLASEPICFETFPHAVVCELAGKIVSAKSKNLSRRMVLRNEGIDDSHLPNIDFVDATLCALTGIYFLNGQTRHYGEAKSGYIVVPARYDRASAPL